MLTYCKSRFALITSCTRTRSPRLNSLVSTQLANGRKAVAAQILESIRQHSVVKPGMGMCFPNVDDIRTYASVIQAFAAMDAPKDEIDAMRQWITVRAQAIDNLGAYNPDYVVAAVMLTGSVWTDVPVSQNVTVDGRPLVRWP